MYKHNTILKNYKEELDDEDYYFYWHVHNMSDNEILHHVIIEDKLEGISVNEYHHQKTYDVKEYFQLLNEAGFEKIAIYSDFNDYNDKSEKHIFICQKG